MAIGRIDDSLLYDIADAIRDKNSSTETYLPSEMPAAITAIETGVDTSDATVTPEDMASGVIAYGSDGTPVEGVLPVWVSQRWNTPTASWNSDDNKLELKGTYGEKRIYEKGATATMYCDGSKLGDASDTDVLSGKSFTSQNGLKIDGGMTNNNAVSLTMDGVNTKSVTVPVGYHNGSGKVSLDNTIDNAVTDIKNALSNKGFASPTSTTKITDIASLITNIKTTSSYDNTSASASASTISEEKYVKLSSTLGTSAGYLQPGGSIALSAKASNFGTATVNDVVSGKSFTGADGFKVNGNISQTVSGSRYSHNATARESLTDVDGVSKFAFIAEVDQDKLYRTGSKIMMQYPKDNFGDAAATDVVSGKYFTSKNGFNVKGTLPVRCSDMGYDLTLRGASAAYINNSSGDNYIRFSYTPTTKVIIDTAYPLHMGSPASNFGDATPNDVVSGKYFTSENGLKKKGTHVCSAGLDTTTDKEPASTDIVSEKEAWANGNKITGSLTEYTSGQMATTKLESVSGGSTFSVTGTIQEDGVFRKGAVIRQWITPTKFGTATVNDVASGVTFTSENGLLLTGMAPRIEFCTVTIEKTQNTYYPYRVYHTDVSSENLIITTPDSLYDKSSYQIPCVKGTYILIDCGDNQVSGHNITISGNLEADVAATYSTGWVVHIRNSTNSNIIGDSVTITVS